MINHCEWCPWSPNRDRQCVGCRAADARAAGRAQGAAEALKQAVDFINDPFEYKGSWTRFVVTTRDNVKSLDQCYDFNDAADDVCVEIVEALERGDHIPKCDPK